ncbi:hypothetical protein F5884DRAFT_304380 [Xylogone sp. PMI_703]|nr:hypothetical protein F5884DRAFT_304380 [Xylogone sp. PMI_703]
MPFNTNLEGSHVLITGGTKGIGLYIVKAFLAEGANVSYCARNVTGHEFDEFLSTTDGIKGKAVGTAVDLGEVKQVEAWIEKAAAEFGRIDSLIANASPVLGTAKVPDDWDLSYKVDILGLVQICDLCVPHLISSPHGSIVVISSIAGWQPAAMGPGPYGPFKRAQHVYAKALSAELGPKGIRVNSIAPGSIWTPEGNIQTAINKWPELMDGVLKSIVLGRWGKGEDIANAALYLASPLAAYVTGTVLFVDGGYTSFA